MNTLTMFLTLAGMLLLACFAAVLIWTMSSQGPDGLFPLGDLRPSKFDMSGRTHYYQIPPNPKGTFVMLHGCARAATGFWPYHPSTPECTGFPEDVAHTKHALVSGYAILVPSPINTRTMCYNFEAGDHKQVGLVIQEFQKRHGLTKKPLYLAGASAGGGTAIRLPEHLAKNGPSVRIDGIICEVATNNGPLTNGGRPAIPQFPPVVYVCMERDVQSQQEAREYIAGLARADTPAALVISPRRRITPAYFADRMHGVTQAQSRQLVDALRTVKMIDEEGWVLANPHEFDKPGSKAFGWMTRMKPLVPAGREFTLGSVRNSPVYQAVAVAYAYHEHVADYTIAALKYFEAGGRASIDDLVARYKVDVPAAM